MEVEDLIEVDDDTILGLVFWTGGAGLPGSTFIRTSPIRTPCAGKVARIVTYTDRAEALEAVGLRE